MTSKLFHVCFAVSTLGLIGLAHSQTRVTTATVPIPMPDKATAPLSPDRLRAESPWTLSVAGDWRFQLTHGQILNGHFANSPAEVAGIRASSFESQNLPFNAFDGEQDSRWCAANGTFPQFLQAKLSDAPCVVRSVEISWERSSAHYQCTIGGSNDGINWTTLADRSAAPGIGDGSINLPEGTRPYQFLRVAIAGASEGSWASIRELRIHTLVDGKDVIWHPATASTTPPPNSDDFVKRIFNDSKWDHLTVPSNWEMAGYSIPTYNSVDDSVGLYRKWVAIPASWKGRRIIWRFDGVLDGAEIYVNGNRAAYHESGYTAFDVDVTGLLIPGEKNLLALRVCKTTPSVECETGDYQCMGGIFRDTRLIAPPVTDVHDLTVRTPLSANYRDAALEVSAQLKGRPGSNIHVSGYVTDAATMKRIPVALEGKVVIPSEGIASLNLSAMVSAPKLWSAEKPSLYYLVLELKQGGEAVEKVEQRFGFRQVEIKNSVVLWNGKPIKCTGVCRHDFWPTKGFALTDAEWSKDLVLMKDTNINAIRTSHYNHAARFLELCEERGFYILDEVPFCWVGDRVSDPKFAQPLLQRAEETVARDKNRPCVLAWSLGNENPVGIDTQQVHDLVKKLDPTRPSFASQAGPNNVKGQELFDSHYPSPGSIDDYLKRRSSIAPEVITEHPHTFYQQDVQTYDPGASDVWSEGLIETWKTLRKSPTMLGSFIWEWQSQGIADKYPDHTTDFYYGLDHMRQENNKGIMTAYRDPKPEQWIVKMVYSPVQIDAKSARLEGDSVIVKLTNLYSFTDLREVPIKWTSWSGDKPLGAGSLSVSCAPGGSVDVKFPAAAGTSKLSVELERPGGGSLTVATITLPGAGVPMPPPVIGSFAPLGINFTGSGYKIGSSTQFVYIDQASGMIGGWNVSGKPVLSSALAGINLGEGKTSPGDHYYRSSKSLSIRDGSARHQFLDDKSVEVDGKYKVWASDDAAQPLANLTLKYVIHPDAQIDVHWELEWTAAETNLWEVGLRFPVAENLDHQSWSRDSYFTAYPNGHLGAPLGSCRPKDAAFIASKRSLNYLNLTDGAGAGISLIADGTPLVGRVGLANSGFTLFASREVAAAGPDDLSFSWFHSHDIHVKPGTRITGDFELRASSGK